MFSFKVRRRGEIRYLAFHPEGRLLVAHGQLWDLTTRKLIRELDELSTWSSRGTFSDDGRLLILSHYARGVDFVEIEGGQSERLFNSVAEAQAAKAPNNTLLVSRGGYNQTPFIAAWNIADTKPSLLWQTEESEQATYASHMAIAPDGQTFAATELRYLPYRTQRLVINSIADGKLVQTISSLTGWGHYVGVHFHPSGEKVLLISDKTIYVYSVEKGNIERRIDKPRGGTFQAFVMHPNARSFVSLHRMDGIVNVWNAETLEITRSFKWPIRKGSALAISPDGLTCAVGDSQGTVVVWDWED